MAETSQAPGYALGIWSMICSHLIEVFVVITLRFVLSRENKRRDRIQSQMEGGLDGRDLDSTAFSDMTVRLFCSLYSLFDDSADVGYCR